MRARKRVLLDTNVIVSGLLSKSSPPAILIDNLLMLKFVLLYSTETIEEYRDVLHRKKFGFDSDDISTFLEFIRIYGEEVVIIPSKYPKFKDEFDRKFYDIYIQGEADFLITGNIKHLPKNKGIITPKQALSKIRPLTE